MFSNMLGYFSTNGHDGLCHCINSKVSMDVITHINAFTILLQKNSLNRRINWWCFVWIQTNLCIYSLCQIVQTSWSRNPKILRGFSQLRSLEFKILSTFKIWRLLIPFELLIKLSFVSWKQYLTSPFTEKINFTNS